MEIRATKPEADYPKPVGARSLRQFYQTNPLCRMDSLTIPTLTPPSPVGRERERYGITDPKASLALCPGLLSVVLSGLQRVWASKLSGFYQTKPCARRAGSKFQVQSSTF